MARPLLMAIPKPSRTWLRFINAYHGAIYHYQNIKATMRTRIDAARLVAREAATRPEIVLRGTFLSLATHHDLGIAGVREGAMFACVNGSVNPVDIRYRLESRAQVVELARRGAFDGGDGFGANAIEGAALKTPVTMDLFMSDPLDTTGRRAFFVDIHNLTHLAYTASDLGGLDLTTYFSIAPEQGLADESDRLFAPEPEDFAALLAARREREDTTSLSDAMAYHNTLTATPAYDPYAANDAPVATAHEAAAPAYGDVVVPEVPDMTDVTAAPAAAGQAPAEPRKTRRPPTFDEIMAGYDPDEDTPTPVTEDETDADERAADEPAGQEPGDNIPAASTTEDPTVDDQEDENATPARKDANGRPVRKTTKRRRKPARRPTSPTMPVAAPEPAGQAGRDLE